MLFRTIVLLFCFFASNTLFSEEEDLQENLFLSTPDQIAALTSEPDYLIGGVVSPLSGQLVLRQTDLTIKGAQNIILSRTYIPIYMPCFFPRHKHGQKEYDKKYLQRYLSANYQGWVFYPHQRLEFNHQKKEVRLSDANGITLDFRLSGANCSESTFISSHYAISNICGDSPGGQYDPRNMRVTYEQNIDKITVHTTHGATRLYRKGSLQTMRSNPYLLEKEITPSGKVLRYRYDAKDKLERIEALDPQERFVYASIDIAGSPRTEACFFTSSSGQAAQYNYHKRLIQWELKGKKKDKGALDERACWSAPPILTAVSSPNYREESLEYCDRFLLGAFSGKNVSFRANYRGFEDKHFHFRVHEVKLPLNDLSEDVFIAVHNISYNPPIAGEREGTTHVQNSDGTSTTYHFSKNLLTMAIQYFDENGALRKEKLFSWYDNQWLK